MSRLAKSVRAMSRAWGATKDAWRFGTRAPQGRVTLPSQRLDAYVQTISGGLNLVKLRNLLAQADSGDLSGGLRLMEEMTQKDLHLAGVVDTRQETLTGLDYEIVSAADVQDRVADRELANDAAEFVRERFAGLESLDEALEHLATAVCANLAVCELVWGGGQVLEDVIEVDSWRLRMSDREPGVVLVETEEEPNGVAALPPKWVVHVPRAPRMHPFRRSALRAQAFVYLIKQLAVIDWATFCEIFGMPVRWATYQSHATAEEKSELMEMMANLGSKAYGVFSDAVRLEMAETSQRGSAPFESLINWCDRKQTILFMRGNLGTDTTGGTGTHAAASVQDEVREDVLASDIRREGRTVRRQIIAPMCAFAYPHRDVPLPYFRRVKPEMVDRLQEADLFGKAQMAGMQIPRAYAYQRLGIPEPQTGEATLEPSLDLMGQGLTEGMEVESAT